MFPSPIIEAPPLQGADGGIQGNGKDNGKYDHLI